MSGRSPVHTFERNLAQQAEPCNVLAAHTFSVFRQLNQVPDFVCTQGLHFIIHGFNALVLDGTRLRFCNTFWLFQLGSSNRCPLSVVVWGLSFSYRSSRFHRLRLADNFSLLVITEITQFHLSPILWLANLPLNIIS